MKGSKELSDQTGNRRRLISKTNFIDFFKNWNKKDRIKQAVKSSSIQGF